MDYDKPMTVIIVEDEIEECIKFKECAGNRSDVKLVGMTDSSEEAIKLVQSHLPEAVILDLQLSRGAGSGIQFLERLSEINLTLRPVVMVTTTSRSKIVYDRIEELGVDFYFCKKQRDYSQELVFDHLLSLRKHSHGVQRANGAVSRDLIESPEERKNRIYNRIDAELNLIGVRGRYKGKVYLREAIYLQIHAEKEYGSVIEKVAQNHRHAYNAISTTMQIAIDNAWMNASPEELSKHYTAHVSAKTGFPTPSDFIHFYAVKIRNSI